MSHIRNRIRRRELENTDDHKLTMKIILSSNRGYRRDGRGMKSSVSLYQKLPEGVLRLFSTTSSCSRLRSSSQERGGGGGLGAGGGSGTAGRGGRVTRSR